METTKNLELKLVKINGDKIFLPDDYINLSAELGCNTTLNTMDRFHPNHLDVVVSNYQGNKQEIIKKINDLGYKLYKENKK